MGFQTIYLEALDQEYWMGQKYIKNKLTCPNMQESSIMEKMLFAAHIRVIVKLKAGLSPRYFDLLWRCMTHNKYC